MPLEEIDTWTKRIVSVAAPDIRRALGEDRLAQALVSEVCLQVQQVLSRLDHLCLTEDVREPWLAEQLALAIYVAVATTETNRQLTPGLLSSLTQRLADALNEGASGRLRGNSPRNRHGGER